MSRMVTRCPQCQTAFKITESQLAVANGAVRCGACLQVFQARQHWVRTVVSSMVTPSPEAATTQADAPWDRFDPADINTPPAEKSLLKEPTATAAASQGARANEASTRLHTGSDPADASWARDLLNGLAQAEAAAGSEVQAAEAQPVEVAPVEVAHQRIEPPTEEPVIRPARAAMIAHIGAPPVEIAPIRKRLQWKMPLMWTGFAVLLLFMAAAQYLYFHFDELARNEEARPWLQSFCGVVGCAMPVAESWRSVQISDLVVRDGKAAHVLAVSAVLMNTSAQPVPFPRLEMYFHDLAQQPVASRRFEPGEYLGAAWKGQRLMPADQPIPITLDLVKPDAAAVNWSLQVAQMPPPAN